MFFFTATIYGDVLNVFQIFVMMPIFCMKTLEVSQEIYPTLLDFYYNVFWVIFGFFVVFFSFTAYPVVVCFPHFFPLYPW